MSWRNTILVGDVREKLRLLPDESVHCVVTSPPYWGLRDYGVEGQLGLEPTPEAYVENMVAVFREVRRVLRRDGTVWLNLGDSYASQGGMHDGRSDNQPGVGAAAVWRAGSGRADGIVDERGQRNRNGNKVLGLKPKDLVGIPWRVAFALQADGWWLRSDIIWSKPNPMPESVTDRPTKAHEYLFLLSKSERYYYDAEAVKEEASPDTIKRTSQATLSTQEGGFKQEQYEQGFPGKKNRDRKPADILKHMHETGVGVLTRNRRTVWEIPTQPYAEAHFATYPEALVLPCIQAGTSEHGCCSECGAPWRRVVEKTGARGESWHNHENDLQRGQRGQGMPDDYAVKTVGWEPTCRHEAPLERCVILDPFMGSGTTGLVAYNAGRDFVGIELNPTYAAMAMKRIGVERGRLL